VSPEAVVTVASPELDPTVAVPLELTVAATSVPVTVVPSGVVMAKEAPVLDTTRAPPLEIFSVGVPDGETENVNTVPGVTAMALPSDSVTIISLEPVPISADASTTSPFETVWV